MISDLKAPAEAERPRLGKAGTLARFALIGVALAAVAGTFAYFGGWLTPNEGLVVRRACDAREVALKHHPGHARGRPDFDIFHSNRIEQHGDILTVVNSPSIGGISGNSHDGPDRPAIDPQRRPVGGRGPGAAHKDHHRRHFLRRLKPLQ